MLVKQSLSIQNNVTWWKSCTTFFYIRNNANTNFILEVSHFLIVRIQNGPKQKGKYLGHFEVWMHIKSCDPISATAVLGHFEVYNSLSTRSFRMRKFGHLWSLRTLSSETNSKFRSRDHDTIFVDGQVISNIFIFSPRHDVQFIFYDR